MHGSREGAHGRVLTLMCSVTNTSEVSLLSMSAHGGACVRCEALLLAASTASWPQPGSSVRGAERKLFQHLPQVLREVISQLLSSAELRSQWGSLGG